MKIRLLALPLVTCCVGFAALHLFSIIPETSILTPISDLIFLTLFAGYAFWWVKGGNAATARLVDQVKAEKLKKAAA